MTSPLAKNVPSGLAHWYGLEAMVLKELLGPGGETEDLLESFRSRAPFVSLVPRGWAPEVDHTGQALARPHPKTAIDIQRPLAMTDISEKAPCGKQGASDLGPKGDS